MLSLILPNQRYKFSYLEAVKEYQAEGLENYLDLDVAVLNRDFSDYIEQLQKESHGQNLPTGYVPHTVLWLVDDNEFIGRIDIRHELNEQLKKTGGHIGYDIRPSKRRQGYGKRALRLALQKAKELGLNAVLVTCDVTNIGSNKIIKANGGVLTAVRPMGEGKPNKNLYRIAS